MTYVCPVCGYNQLEEPVSSPSGDSFEICPCCFFEFGVDDVDIGFTYEQWREVWINQGMPWRSTSTIKPDNFNPGNQLKNISDDN